MVDALPEPAGDETLRVRRSTWARWIWLPVLAVLAAVGGWHAAHPAPLPPAGSTVTASTPASVPVFVGVLARTAGEDRSISLRGVESVVEGGDAEVEALICRGSAFAVTTDPHTFCDDLDRAVRGTLDLGAGDSLVLRVEAAVPGERTIDGVTLSYRQGLQWDTQRVGPRLELTVLGR
jgi:hypothetical protein